MKPRWEISAVVAVATAFVAGCGKAPGTERQGPPPVPVTAYRVEPGEAQYFNDYPAIVTALDQVELRPEVSGYITGIFFKDGQHVHKGEKLYEFDPQQYKAAYDQAEANLSVARSNLAKARQDADRYNDLAKEDAVARQTLEHAQEDYEASKMQVAAAEASVKNVETNLRYATLYAPFDGTIGISLAKVGSSVTGGQTLLNTISSDDPMGVDCSVDQTEITMFSDLLQKRPDGRDSTFEIILPDGSVYPNRGRLSLLDRAVDPQTGTIRIRVVFPNPRNVLRPGLTCDLRIRTNSPASTLLLPYRAVTEQMGEFFVYVVDGGKVSQQRIALGARINDMVVVRSGLQAGEEIVLEGMQKLRDNSPVVVRQPEPRADAGASEGDMNSGRK